MTYKILCLWIQYAVILKKNKTSILILIDEIIYHTWFFRSQIKLSMLFFHFEIKFHIYSVTHVDLTLTGNLQYAGKCTVRAGRGHARKKDWKNLWENGFQWWWTFNETGVHRGLYEGPSPVSNAYGGCGYQPIMVPNRLFHFIYSSRFTKK